ncbi:hypothetical protein ACWDAO_28415, partial [Streptomyces sp. NPDC001212]
MSRRVSLPGADELFRTTGGMALQPSTPRRQAGGEARVPAPAAEGDAAASAEDAPQSVPAQGGDGEGAEHVAVEAAPTDAGDDVEGQCGDLDRADVLGEFVDLQR